jgi:3D (Asp-Asp-Asp) domain-containing protein
MHSRKSNYVDVWMPSKAEAMQFGKTKTKIVIVEMPA